MTSLVFCYGTLKRGHANHWLMEGAKYHGNYFTDKNYSLYVEGLPFLVKEKGGGGCFGELYEVTDEILEKLDRLEGHPTFYKREKITVYDAEVGAPVEGVWVYLFNAGHNEINKRYARKTGSY